MQTFKDLQKKIEADRELVRCRKEFSRLCERLPNLPPNEAVFQFLMSYFQPDTRQFDFLSAAEAIANDKALCQNLGYRDDEEVAIDNQKAAKATNDHNKSLSDAELHAELKRQDREFLAKHSGPKPPADLTYAVFIKAPKEQVRQWVEKYTSPVLNAHFAQQEVERV